MVASGKNNLEEWVLDSGCTFHMSFSIDLFDSIEEHEGGRVLMGNNAACKVIGIGSIKLQLHGGTVRILTSVRYVPELKRNFISLGILDDGGYRCKVEKGMLKV